MEKIEISQLRSHDVGSWGTPWGVSRVGGPRAEPPDAGEFSKIFKEFLKKIAKDPLFSHMIQKC